MQTPLFPGKINLWQLATEGGRLDGGLNLAELSRLAALLNRVDGTVNLALVAGIDERNARFIKGTLRTEIELICQRCLGPLRLSLDVTVNLGLVHGEAEASRLPAGYEPLQAPEGGTAIADLVEDELLLALPQIPRHEDVGECEANGYRMHGEPAPAAGPSQPFAVLMSLLQDSKRSN